MSFTLNHLVQFSETDLAGVVHFSNYFRWMEEIEHAFFRSLGLSVHPQPSATAQADSTYGWPRIAASCEYLGPARFEDEITLHLRITRIGSKSLTYEVDFSIKDHPIAKGQITSVCCKMNVSPAAKFQTIPIPLAIRAKLTGA